MSPFSDTVQKGDKYALTALTFIHSDCCTVNIQKADMCSKLGSLGPWQVINQWNHNREARLGFVCVYVCVCVCVFVCEWGGRFTGREASVTAINVRSLQTPHSTLLKACECNSALSGEKKHPHNNSWVTPQTLRNSKYSTHTVDFCCQMSDTTAIITRQVKVAQIWYFSFLFLPHTWVKSFPQQMKQNKFYIFMRFLFVVLNLIRITCGNCDFPAKCVMKLSVHLKKKKKTTHSCNWAVWMHHYGGM